MIESPQAEYRTLTREEFEQILASGQMEEVSGLSDGYVKYGQIFRKKVKYEGKEWIASAWKVDNVVSLIEVI